MQQLAHITWPGIGLDRPFHVIAGQCEFRITGLGIQHFYVEVLDVPLDQLLNFVPADWPAGESG